MKPSFYAVAVGKARGIYSTWAQCSEQVTGYPGSVYKGFRTLAEARAFLASRPPVLAAAADTANGGADGKGGNNAGGRSDPSSPLAAHATPAATPAPSAMPTARGTCGGGSSGAAVKRPRSLIDVDVGDEDGGGASRVTPQPTRQRASAPLSPLPVTNSTASEGLGGAAGVQSVYVDGACSANGTALARAGYGGFYGSLTDSRNFACPVPLSERQTNNRGELRAVVHAIVQAFVDAGAATAEALKVTHSVDPTQWQLADLARPLPHLVIYTDSRYVIDGLTRFAKTWVANGFVLSTKKPVENQDLWRQLIRLRDHYNSLYAHQQHNALRRAEVGGAPPVRHTCANTNNDKSEGIELVHVRGHSNNVGNEMADSLAVSGSRKHGP